ncbi:ABC transporter substrate-binding protein [Hyphococcus flavus]|uniref:ABC transporter substrate-binding protein n=1 Tax=Hyphococcus flavus TaxID=1866326 RepID=A0AAE9ZIG7_9PROT|nr:ABC transporter substrate-binding protein [Hyphococcus flavus]WDI30915.1 ABC transporter substrate-binding protein [Hyphococcus flavus]
MFMSRVRILAALVAASAVTPAVAQEGAAPAAEEEVSAIDSATDFARSLIDEASQTLTNESLSEEDRLQTFRTFLGEKMDLDFISRIVLAKRYRSEMTEEQNQRYDAAFPAYMTRIYADQFDQIFGKPYSVVDSKPASRGDVFVATDFEVGDRRTLNVVWRIRNSDGENKIVDIIVQGGSIITLKREEFSSFVAANGVDALIETLEGEAA